MIGRVQHVVAHLAERKPDIEARLRDIFEERGGERAVRSVAVIGDGAGLGRKSDQRVGDALVDSCKPHRHAPRHARVVGRGMKRIFPAGVENDQAELFDMARGHENPVQRHRLIVYVERAGQFRIDWDEVVRAAVFQTMSGIVDDGDVGVRRPVDEFTNGPLELDDAEIEAQIDNVESRFLQQGADRVGVVDRIRRARPRSRICRCR